MRNDSVRNHWNSCGSIVEATAHLMSASPAGHKLLHQRLAPRQSGLKCLFVFSKLPDVFDSSS